MILTFSKRVVFLFHLLRYLSKAQAEGDELNQPRSPPIYDDGGEYVGEGVRSGRVGSLWGPKVGLSWGEDLAQESDDVDWLPKDWEMERWGGEECGPAPVLAPSLRNYDMKVLGGPAKKAGGVGDYPDDDYYDYQSEKQMLKRVQPTATPRQGILGQAEAGEGEASKEGRVEPKVGEGNFEEGAREKEEEVGGKTLQERLKTMEATDNAAGVGPKVIEEGFSDGAREKAEEVGGKALQAGLKALEAGGKAVETGFKAFDAKDGESGASVDVKVVEEATNSSESPVKGPSSFEREILSDLLSKDNNTINAVFSSSDSFAHDEDVSRPVEESPTEKIRGDLTTQESAFSEEDLDVLNVLKGLLMSLNNSDPFTSDDYSWAAPLSVDSNFDNSFYTSGSGIPSEIEPDRQKPVRTMGGSSFAKAVKSSSTETPSEEKFIDLLRNVRNMLNATERKELEKFLINALRAKSRKSLNPRRCGSPRLSDDGSYDQNKDEFVRLKLKGLKKHKKIGREIERVISKILTDEEDDHLDGCKINKNRVASEKQSERKMRRFHGNNVAIQKELHSKGLQNSHSLFIGQDGPGFGVEGFSGPVEIGITENLIPITIPKGMRKNASDKTPFTLGSTMKPCAKEETFEINAVLLDSWKSHPNSEPLDNTSEINGDEKLSQEYLRKNDPVYNMRTLSKQFTSNGYLPPAHSGMKQLTGDLLENASVFEEGLKNSEEKEGTGNKGRAHFENKYFGIDEVRDETENKLLSFLKNTKQPKLKSSYRKPYHLESLPKIDESRMNAFKKEMNLIKNVLSQDYDYDTDLMLRTLRLKPEGKRPHWLNSGNR